MFTIGIDLGGTNIKAGLVDNDGVIRQHSEIPTEAARGFDHVFDRLTTLVQSFVASATEPITAIGIGVPGPMSHAEGIIFSAPNLPGWTNIPMRRLFSAATGLPVVLENDANAAAYGEFVAGAGRDVNDLVLLTLGTGIGGGVILGGKLWRGAFDNAGEIGHTIAVPGGRPCTCGQIGCLERYSSATAVADRLVEAVLAGAQSVLADDARRQAAAPTGKRLIDAARVQDAAQAGDALSQRIWHEMTYYLALACVNLQHTLNIRRIVLGGGMTHAGDVLLRPVREQFMALSWRIAPDHPEITLATLGSDAGLIGAAALARPG